MCITKFKVGEKKQKKKETKIIFVVDVFKSTSTLAQSQGSCRIIVMCRSANYTKQRLRMIKVRQRLRPSREPKQEQLCRRLTVGEEQPNGQQEEAVHVMVRLSSATRHKGGSTATARSLPHKDFIAVDVLLRAHLQSVFFRSTVPKQLNSFDDS